MFENLIKILQDEITKLNRTIVESEKACELLKMFLDNGFDIFKGDDNLFDIPKAEAFLKPYVSEEEISNIKMGLMILNNCHGNYSNEFGNYALSFLTSISKKIEYIRDNIRKINNDRKINVQSYRKILRKFSLVDGSLIDFIDSLELKNLFDLLKKVEFDDYTTILKLNEESITLYERKLKIIQIVQENRKRILKRKNSHLKDREDNIDKEKEEILNKKICEARDILAKHSNKIDDTFAELFMEVSMIITDIDALKELADTFIDNIEKRDYYLLFIKLVIDSPNKRTTSDMEMLNFAMDEVSRYDELIIQSEKDKEREKNAREEFLNSSEIRDILSYIENLISNSTLPLLSEYDQKRVNWINNNIFDSDSNFLPENVDTSIGILDGNNDLTISLCILSKIKEAKSLLDDENLTVSDAKNIIYKLQNLLKIYNTYLDSTEVLDGDNDNYLDTIKNICSLDGSPNGIQVIFLPLGEDSDITTVEDFAYSHETKNKYDWYGDWFKTLLSVLMELRNFSLGDLSDDRLCKKDVTHLNTRYRCRKKRNTRCVFDILKYGDKTILLIMAYGIKNDKSLEWEYLQTPKSIKIHDTFVEKFNGEIMLSGLDNILDKYHQKGYEALVRLGIATGKIDEKDSHLSISSGNNGGRGGK